MNYSNQWLIEKYKTKEKVKFLFFWGHQPAKDGNVTQSCLSQWWHAPFILDNVTYKTAEHFMMAEKARLFNDANVLEHVLKSNSPADAKKLGRTINSFNPDIWDQKKFDIVVSGNYYKFSQHEDLKAFLLNTKDRVLVEASPVDKIWGIGMAADNPNIENPLMWKGENLLGYALMSVRNKLS